MTFERKEMEARYRLFEQGVLQDQRSYYHHAIEVNEQAAASANRWRATFALIAGIASIIIALLASDATPGDAFAACYQAAPNVDETCTFTVKYIIPVLLVISVVAPALGAAFTTLADLYQWDRLTAIYTTATKSLAIADALSPLDEMDDPVYLASLDAFAEGTLRVMRDETSQWGQLIKTPDALQKYIDEAKQTADNIGQ
ncbi:MAG: hypothetical protein D6737_14295 [Chloroflexi bacterium]|nr:MAG: hypothetical protein D6737_14295 [Chloroflexota bacterium]